MDEDLVVRVWRRPPGSVEAQVMGLLSRRLPLCLIMDLVMPAGPHSRDLLEAERTGGSPRAPGRRRLAPDRGA